MRERKLKSWIMYVNTMVNPLHLSGVVFNVGNEMIAVDYQKSNRECESSSNDI